MASTVDSLTFDCRDPQVVADFWCAVLGYDLVEIDEEGADLRDPKARGWRLLFLIVPEGKTVKNRVHLDLHGADVAAEILLKALDKPPKKPRGRPKAKF